MVRALSLARRALLHQHRQHLNGPSCHVSPVRLPTAGAGPAFAVAHHQRFGVSRGLSWRLGSSTSAIIRNEKQEKGRKWRRGYVGHSTRDVKFIAHVFTKGSEEAEGPLGHAERRTQSTGDDVVGSNNDDRKRATKEGGRKSR